MSRSMLLILGLVSAFTLYWMFLSWLFAVMSGWRELASAYPAPEPCDGDCWHFQSAALRWGFGFNGCLNVCANSQGVHLSILFVFSFAQPPVFMPWSDISGTERKNWLSSSVELRFRQAPTIPFRIGSRLANKLEQASGGVWHYAHV